MDPDNPIVKLCAQGMEEESKGNYEQAANLFGEAWNQSGDDLERCIAAHYVARHQASPSLSLHWNQVALDCAERVGSPSVAEFLPSLHLNLGKSHEDLGNLDAERQNFAKALDELACLPAGPYRDIVQDGI